MIPRRGEVAACSLPLRVCLVPVTNLQNPDPGTPEFEALLGAWDQLAEGEADSALSAVAALSDELPVKSLVVCAAMTMKGEVKQARVAMDRSIELGVDEDDPEVVRIEGELLLSEWRVEDAMDVFGRLSQMEGLEPYAYDRLALCHDLMGDPAAADEATRTAYELAPEDTPPPVQLPVREFQAVVLEVIEGLKGGVEEILNKSEVIVAPVPAAELEREPGTVPPDALGLFMGISELQRAGDDAPLPTPVIYLFKRNIERESLSVSDLRQQIAITFLHELGHLLGFDEEGVEGMGLA